MVGLADNQFLFFEEDDTPDSNSEQQKPDATMRSPGKDASSGAFEASKAIFFKSSENVSERRKLRTRFQLKTPPRGFSDILDGLLKGASPIRECLMNGCFLFLSSLAINIHQPPIIDEWAAK